MTGEVTLRGNVLPIGGLKEKLLAALRGGIKTVLIPEENAKDLTEIPDNVKQGLTIIPGQQRARGAEARAGAAAGAGGMGRGGGRGRSGGAACETGNPGSADRALRAGSSRGTTGGAERSAPPFLNPFATGT